MSRATAKKKEQEKNPLFQPILFGNFLLLRLIMTGASPLPHPLTTRDYPDPDLLIRTGGELRVSNFLLWQMAYTEFYFTELLWPDFRHEDFYEAVAEYQRRQRRFGKTGAQVEGA